MRSADAAAMFALEPATGRVLWVNHQAYDVTHLLGAVDGRLIATGRQLWMLDAVTGRTDFAWPDSPAAGVTGRGRGCLAGREIFWPTEQAIYTFDIATGQQTRSPIPLDELGGQGGANVVPCGKGLLVATENRLTLFGAEIVPQEDANPPAPALGMR